MNLRRTSQVSAGGASLTGGAGSGLARIYAAALVVCAVLTGAAYVLGIEPAAATRDADAAARVELHSRREKASELAASLGATQRKLEQTRREVADLHLVLEPASAVNQRLARLADLAGAAGLVINEVQPGPAADSAHYQAVPIRLSGSGSYPGCGKFLHQLRDRFADTACRSFEAANPAPTRDNTTGTFRFDLTWYTAPGKR